MATAETVTLGPSHPPKDESFKVFNELKGDLKKTLRSLRHDHDKHEPEYFAAVKDLSDDQLVNFSDADLEEVRVGTSAYGIHLFGKVLLPEAAAAAGEKKYIMFRAFVPGEAENAKLHSIHTEEVESSDGNRSYRAIFSKGDELEWFDT